MSLKLTDKCFIIAEAGTCHAHHDPEERYYVAMDYVNTAVAVGVDAIKFQMFLDPNPETMFCWIDGDEDRSRRWKQSVLSLEKWHKVKNEAEARGIMFLSSAFEYETVKWQTELGVAATKVASRAAGYLDKYKDAPKPLLVSNGMYPVAEAKDQIILQCEANYPSTTRWQGEPFTISHKSISTDKISLAPGEIIYCGENDIRCVTGFTGFSDHSGHPWRAIEAMARGCRLLEVHFYMNPSHAGPDYPASLTLDELKLVREARDAFVL